MESYVFQLPVFQIVWPLLHGPINPAIAQFCAGSYFVSCTPFFTRGSYFSRLYIRIVSSSCKHHFLSTYYYISESTPTVTYLPPPYVMRHWQCSSTVQQDLENLIVVLVGRQDEWCDVWCEGSYARVHLLPALTNDALVSA